MDNIFQYPSEPSAYKKISKISLKTAFIDTKKNEYKKKH